MKLRILESQWTPFVNALCARRDVESAGIILAERLHGGEALLAKQLLLVPNDGYLVRRIDQLRIDPIALNRLIRAARDSGLSVFTVHTHPGATQPWFSRADDIGDAKLMPSLFTQMPGPHGSMVIAGNTGITTARAWLENGSQTKVDINIIGKAPHFPTGSGGANSQSMFARQRLALGNDGQEILKNLHVAIVGLGGTGSVSFVQLAHLGVGHISVVDGDLVESSNVSRIIGATVADIGNTYKVDVAARYAASLGLGTKVTPMRGHLGGEFSTQSIEGCDIILSCVDRHIPRAVINRLAYAKAIPTIDMGSAFRIGADGKISGGAGRVVVIGPERRCLACWGHIDPHRMRVEALPPAERAKETAEGYIEGADIPQPSVIAFNTAVAGAAVTELLRLVTRFGGHEDPPMRLSFDFLSGTIRRNTLVASISCKICLATNNEAERFDSNDIENRLNNSDNTFSQESESE